MTAGKLLGKMKQLRKAGLSKRELPSASGLVVPQ